MTLATNGDRLLIFGDINLGALIFDFDTSNFSRTQSLTDEFRKIFAPVDNVDFFTIANFIHYGLNTDATTTNEGTDWIDTWNGAGDSNLSTTTSLTGDSTNFNDTSFDFRDLLHEELLNEVGRATANKKLSTTLVALNGLD